MKRSSSSDSMSGAGDMGLIQLRPPNDEKRVYGRLGSFQSILDGVDEGPEEMLGDGDDELCSPGAGGGVDSFGSSEKKRRLSTEQVKALERYFEVENKLEPERKSKLAQELGLQPRQVAVWFQNRRARWKTKQLERDYNALKSNYDNLKQNYDALHNENEALLTELKELKAKLAADGGESSYCSIKEEPVVAPKEEQATEKMVLMGEGTEDDEGDLEMEPPALIYKDGSSESDSSAILNGDTSPRHLSATAISSSSGILFDHHSLQEELDQPPQSMFLGFNCNPSSASSSPSFPCPDSGRNNRFGYYYCPQQQFKVEEHGFFSAEDPSAAACFFADETPPNLSWYCSDQWN